MLATVVVTYSSTGPARLCVLRERKGLSVEGSKEELIARLGEDDRETMESKIERLGGELVVKKREFEEEV